MTDTRAVSSEADPADRIGPGVRIDLLGALRVQIGDDTVALGPAAQQRLLGVLALHPGKVISKADLVDLLWGTDPPRSCQALLYTYIARLRRLLTPAATDGSRATVIQRRNGGYGLFPTPDSSDLLQFDELAARLRETREPEERYRLSASALAYWRGPLLDGLEDRLRQHPSAIAVQARRVQVALIHADAAIVTGCAGAALELIRPVAASEPLHEELHARLMLLLAAAGQRAAALRHFTVLRRELTDQLGIEPGPQLRAVHLRLLRDDEPAANAPRTEHVPQQLPYDVYAFVGRAEELRRLDGLVPQATAERGGLPIAVLTGMAGIGKTALVVHWAHRIRDRFPDGQFVVQLRGHAGGPPTTASQALEHVLRSLGVPGDAIPTAPRQAAALYRSLVSSRRTLIILDDAVDSAQVRPLLPGAPGAMVVVTSRHRLTGLVATDGARRVALGCLPADDAARLLADTIGAGRTRAEPAATAELAAACAYLPLALRIAAANIGDDPDQSIAGYVTRLQRGNRLAALSSIDGEAAVQAAFDLSYRRLDLTDRRVFRFLALVPGTDFTTEAIAALTALPTADTSLRRLTAAHLVQARGPDRFGLHDLMRLYAAERTRTEDPQNERSAALGRLLDWYHARTHHAARLLHPGMLRLPAPEQPCPVDDEQAEQWLDAEYPNIIEAIRHAARSGPSEMTWLITDALRPYLWKRATPRTWAEIAQAGRHAAGEAAEPRGEAVMRLSLADLELQLSRYEPAMEHAAALLDTARRTGWTEAEATAHTVRTAMLWRLGRLAEAAGEGELGLVVDRRLGLPRGHAATLGNLALIYRDLGRLADAERMIRLALELAGPDQLSRSIRLSNLGEVVHLQGRLDDAHRYYRAALAVEHRFTEAETLYRLAALLRDTGDTDRAESLARQSLNQARETGDRRAQAGALNILAGIVLCIGRPSTATRYYDESIRLADRIGEPGIRADALVGLAAAQNAAGNTRQALASATQALEICHTTGFRLVEVRAREELSRIHLDLGQAAEAARQAGAATAIRRETGCRPADPAGAANLV